jgi:hypothetical protein
MRQPMLIDGRRIYNPKKFKQKMKFTARAVDASEVSDLQEEKAQQLLVG